MRKTPLIALAIAAAAPAAAQEDWHPVSPGNTWSITESDCSIDGGWEGDIYIVINRHDDHHDFGVYDKKIKGLVPEKVIPVWFGTGGDRKDAMEYQALGHKEDGQLSYVSNVDDALLDRIAQGGSFQFYRGKKMIEDLDMVGFAEALGAMRSCEAKLPSEFGGGAGMAALPAEEAEIDPQDEAAMAALRAAADAAADAAASRKGKR